MYATANRDDPVDDVAWGIMREISRMCYSPVDEDIIRAKNQLKAAILFSQDNLNGELCLVERDGLLVVSFVRWGCAVARGRHVACLCQPQISIAGQKACPFQVQV